VKNFAARVRRISATGPGVRSRTREARLGLPHRFEAVGEALTSGSGLLDACAVAGQDLARDGASMQEALDGLRDTAHRTAGGDPPFDAVSSLLTAWGETTLGYLHQLSCDDPLTGLSSQAHLRSRLSELHRLPPTEQAVAGHALVVCTLPFGDDPSEEPVDHFTRAMRLARAGEMARTVFARDETVARVGMHRVAVLARRDDRLGRRVRVLRTLLGGVEGPGSRVPGGPVVRVWIEGLPSSDAGTGMLLDELARG